MLALIPFQMCHSTKTALGKKETDSKSSLLMCFCDYPKRYLHKLINSTLAAYLLWVNQLLRWLLGIPKLLRWVSAFKEPTV